MTLGFPEGTPMRKGVTFVYNTFSPVQFLRTTHKAGPLVALALACLAGVGAAALVRRVGRGGDWWPWPWPGWRWWRCRCCR